MASVHPADEDAFLWEESVALTPSSSSDGEPLGTDAPAPLSEAEKRTLKLCVDVMLQSAFALEDPNERYNKLFGHLQKAPLPSKQPVGREISSDDLANNLYEEKLAGGVVGLEVNPPDAPALSRTVLIGGRVPIMMSKLLLIFDRAALFSAVELSPFRMTDPTNPETDGNRFFRLVSDPSRKMAHDVACLIAWMQLEDGANMLEVSAWPIEKA